MMKHSWFTPLTVLVIVVVASVYYTVQSVPMRFHEITPSIVRIGVLPDVSERNLHQRYKPLLKYLSEETGLDFKLVLPADYEELLHFFSMHEVELALFGGLTFVQAQASYLAEALVMRDVDTRFTSVFLVGDSNPANELADLEGSSFAFGSRLSTSGHLMPRHFMKDEKQILPEKFFGEIVYSGAHDKTAYMVRDGEVDIGAANAEIIAGMFRDGRLKEEEVRILWETPPYPDYVWAVPRNLNEDIKTQLRDAFLKLDSNDAYHSHILAGVGAMNFLPAGIRRFLPLQRIAASLELLDPV